MNETSVNIGQNSQKIFISYSRADRQRVLGLAVLLEGLNHKVFIDQPSIRAGERWNKKLEEEIKSADILLVFWTRHAAKSKWVRREYEQFIAHSPDRNIVPTLGDTTPLNDTLSVYQYADFCPLINELLSTVGDLEEKGVSKREIRTVVSKRLEEEGIELPPDKRNRIFGMLGVIGLTTVPLHLLLVGSDWLVDKAVGLPSAYYYTAGAAAALGMIICHSLTVAIDGRSGSEQTPDIYKVPITQTPDIDPTAIMQTPDIYKVDIELYQSGTMACDAKDMICVSVSRGEALDTEGKFFGYITPTCSAKIISKPSCKDTSYAINEIVVRKSPNADADVEDLSGESYACLISERGKQGAYQSANCVEP